MNPAAADGNEPAVPSPACATASLQPEKPTKPSMLRRVEALAATVPTEAEIVILGDSLAAGWPLDALRGALDGASVFRFGIPGERIQHTLWRLDAVPTGHLRPRHVILLLGTNNLGDGDPVERITAGLGAVVAAVRHLWRGPAIHLVTLPWRHERPTFCEAARRTLNGRLLPDLARALDLKLIDADAVLGVGPDAEVNLLPDLLHLGPAGYEALTGAVLDAIARS